MKSHQHMLCVLVVLHFGPGFYKWVDCALVRKPKNIAALSGEVVTLQCASSVSEGNIAWSTVRTEDFIYINRVLAPSVSSYISVSDKDDGNCILHINASLTAAKRYICLDQDSGEEASAELIVLANHMKCNSQIEDVTVHVNCSIVSAGNWNPVIECEQENKDHLFGGLQGNQAQVRSNDVVTTTWKFSSNQEQYDIICSTEFKHTDRRRETVPAYSAPRNTTCQNGLSSRKFNLSSDDIVLGSEANYSDCNDTNIGRLQRKYEKALSTISFISCIISGLALILTVLVCVLTWNQYGPQQGAVLLTLSLALLIADAIFMLGASIVVSKNGCKAVLVALHYFFLVAFFIVFTEGVELMLYVKYHFRKKIPTIMLFASAWVLPLIIVIVPLVLSEVERCGNDLACRLTFDNGLMWIFVAPVLCIIMGNYANRTIAFVWMTRGGSFLANIENKGDDIGLRATLWNMSVACPVLGSGCLLGVFSVVFSSVVFQYLFFITNSLLGLLIFIFHALYFNKEMNEKISGVYSNYICCGHKTDPSVPCDPATALDKPPPLDVPLLDKSTKRIAEDISRMETCDSLNEVSVDGRKA